MRSNGGVGIETGTGTERGSGGHGENTHERAEIEQIATGAGSEDGSANERPGTPNKKSIKTGSGRVDERADTSELD